jgi:hypothetical protein
MDVTGVWLIYARRVEYGTLSNAKLNQERGFPIHCTEQGRTGKQQSYCKYDSTALALLALM